MKIDAYKEQNKITELLKSEESDKAARKSVFGKALAEAVSFDVDNRKENIFASGNYGSERDGETTLKSMEELRSEVETMAANLKAIFNKMDMGELVRMDEEGTDVNDMEVEKIVTVAEQIRIKMAAYGNGDVYLGDIDEDAVKEVLGDGMAYMVADKLAKYSYPVTEDNIKEIAEAVTIAKELEPLSYDSKVYLMKNSLEPTVENLYTAQHAGNYGNRTVPISDEQWNTILPQVEEKLVNAGIKADEETLGDMRSFINNGVGITEEALILYKDITEAEKIIAGLNSQNPEMMGAFSEAIADKMVATMVDRDTAKAVNLSDKPVTWQKAKHTMEVLEGLTTEGLLEFVGNDEYEQNIEGLAKAHENIQNGKPVNTDILSVLGSSENVSKYRQIQEIRLVMTFEAAYVMEKNGIDVNFTQLSVLVEELKQLEEGLVNSRLSVTDEVEGLSEVIQKVNDLKNAPCAVIGRAAGWQKVNLELLSEAAKVVQQQYEQAGKAYEAMFTEVRPDLGDRLDKAVAASTDSLLKELNQELTEENRRAVRIISYNSMEMTIENFNKVKAIDTDLNELFYKMLPDIALDMLRDGIDILGMEIKELSKEADERSKKKDTVRAVKFSEYLYELDHSGEISAEDREKYMALYTILNKIQKDDGNAVGQLANQNLDANLSNLVTAYMTRNNAGMNSTVTDENAVNEQGRRAAHNNAKLNYYKNLLSELGKLPQEAVELVTQNELPHTVNNLAAAGLLYKDRSYVYKGLEDNNIDASLDEFFESMDSREGLCEKYEELAKAARELMASQTGSLEDINYLKQIGNGMTFLSSLASHNTFYLPYNSENGTGAIKLQVNESSEESGTFTVEMESESLGRVQVYAKVSSGELNAYILVTNVSSDVIANVTKNIEGQLNNLGFEKVKLNASKTEEFPKSGNGAVGRVETKKLFMAAKVFVQSFR